MKLLQKLKSVLRIKKRVSIEIQKPFFWGSAPWYKKQPATIIYNVDYLKDETFSTQRGHAHTAFLMQDLFVPQNLEEFFVLKQTENFEIGVHNSWLYRCLEKQNIKNLNAASINGNQLIMASISAGKRRLNYEMLNTEGKLKYGEGGFRIGLYEKLMILSNFKHGNLIIRNNTADTFLKTANYCEYEGPKYPGSAGKYLRIYISEEIIFEYQTLFN